VESLKQRKPYDFLHENSVLSNVRVWFAVRTAEL
jgi:hypothetical protein